MFQTEKITRPVPVVPPAGPAWFGSIMGTGILATLLSKNSHGFRWIDFLSILFLVIAWMGLLYLTGKFIFNSFKLESFFKNTILVPNQLTAWGMFSMGYTAVGAATATVLPKNFGDLTNTAWAACWSMWIIGFVSGILVTFRFTFLMIRDEIGTKSFTWGLPLVPPMVSATGATTLVEHTGGRAGLSYVMALTALLCFTISIFIGSVTFVVIYQYVWKGNPLGLAVKPTAWIPLGVVGQSTAAVQGIGGELSKKIVLPAYTDTVLQIAHIYGITVLLVGIPLFIWAQIQYYGGLLQGMGFSPAWWASTFPVGTCALGSFMLGDSMQVEWLKTVSLILTLLLLIHWLIAAFATIKALWLR